MSLEHAATRDLGYASKLCRNVLLAWSQRPPHRGMHVTSQQFLADPPFGTRRVLTQLPPLQQRTLNAQISHTDANRACA
jgi:hypothetical protein